MSLELYRKYSNYLENTSREITKPNHHKMAEAAASDQNERKESIHTLATDAFTLFSYMDEVESRVDVLRRQVSALVGEQASLMMIIDQLKSDCLVCDISAEDRQELLTHIERLKARCTAVQMQVQIVRDEGQIQSLHKVNGILHDLHNRLYADSDSVLVTAVHQAHTYLNACLPESVGAVDIKFQSLVLGCALDDQKDVRRQLETLVREHSSTFRSRSPRPYRSGSSNLHRESDQNGSNNFSESTGFFYISAKKDTTPNEQDQPIGSSKQSLSCIQSNNPVSTMDEDNPVSTMGEDNPPSTMDEDNPLSTLDGDTKHKSCANAADNDRDNYHSELWHSLLNEGDSHAC